MIGRLFFKFDIRHSSLVSCHLYLPFYHWLASNKQKSFKNCLAISFTENSFRCIHARVSHERKKWEPIQLFEHKINGKYEIARRELTVFESPVTQIYCCGWCKPLFKPKTQALMHTPVPLAHVACNVTLWAFDSLVFDGKSLLVWSMEPRCRQRRDLFWSTRDLVILQRRAGKNLLYTAQFFLPTCVLKILRNRWTYKHETRHDQSSLPAECRRGFVTSLWHHNKKKTFWIRVFRREIGLDEILLFWN